MLAIGGCGGDRRRCLLSEMDGVVGVDGVA